VWLRLNSACLRLIRFGLFSGSRQRMIQQSRRFSRLHETRLSLTVALVVAALAWIFLGYSLGPVVIAKAYHGESLAILNHLIKGQATHPLTEYLAHWNRIASKVSFGLAILCAYILLAIVRVTREAPVGLHEAPGKVAMPKPRRLVVYGLGVVIFGGALSDLIRDTEHWPFSQYPMFSRIQVSKTYSTLRLYGVVQRSPLIEVPLDSNVYLQPFDNSRLAAALEGALEENRVDEGLTDCLTRYEALRRAGVHHGPPIAAMRLYSLTWKLDPSASNVERPDRKQLLAEVPPRQRHGD